MVERDVQLAQQFTGARLHVAHLSTADALKAVRRGKRSKSQVTCEVTPHHFALTDADVGEYDSNFKMNPPLRSDADREAILVGLADGTIDAIATDHAPHAPHEKIIEFERAAFGITGLELRSGLLSLIFIADTKSHSAGLSNSLLLARRACSACEGAARWFGAVMPMSRSSIRKSAGRLMLPSHTRGRRILRLVARNLRGKW